MKIESVAIGNYKSIGDEPITLDLTKKINVLVGKNNAGKSNVIGGIQFLSNLKSKTLKLEPHERHYLDLKNEIRFKLTGVVTNDDIAIPGLPLPQEIWIDFYLEKRGIGKLIGSVFDKMPSGELSNWSAKILGATYNNIHVSQGVREDVSRKLSHVFWNDYFLKNLQRVFIVPQFRQIIEGDTYSMGGSGLVRLLASWQNPSFQGDDLRKRFRAVEAFCKKLIRDQNAKIEVEHEKKEILIEQRGLRLPLASYGTGIHELILLSVAIYSEEQALFCIEEPEIHLHPSLQREMLQLLLEHNSNRFFISTHSNVLIQPHENIAIIHLLNSYGITRGERVETSADGLLILNDLGVQASDLLQSNCIIWVEGPSDRIYIRKWIELIAPEWKEGLHYQIMFYGGKLLSNLSMDRTEDENVDDLIELLQINQNSAIVIDSDKDSMTKDINSTKKRIENECVNNNLVCWITKGREIENYLHVDSITKAYDNLTGYTPVSNLVFGLFDRIEESTEAAYSKTGWKTSWNYAENKPKRAREIAEYIEKSHISSDLKSELDRIINIISQANTN